MFKRKFMQIFVKKNQQKEEITEKTGKLLKNFYNSFFSDIFNEMNIDRYRPIRDATGMVINKFTANDHPLAYAGKLVLFIQAYMAMNQLHLTKEQQQMLQELADLTKHVNLNYVYISPLDSMDQFLPEREKTA
ncbi:bacteriocin immunity protein [Lactobacillus porci]|uniref:bacteriocin immunity protein n=1 Tax=Lactobacillus porci TaxID=2012477 RepID=UPI0039946DF6